MPAACRVCSARLDSARRWRPRVRRRVRFVRQETRTMRNPEQTRWSPTTSRWPWMAGELKRRRSAHSVFPRALAWIAGLVCAASGSGASGGGSGCRLPVHDQAWRCAAPDRVRFTDATRDRFRRSTVELRDENVILVDGGERRQPGPADRRHAPRRPDVATGRSPEHMEDVLRQSPEMLSFLRCDTRLADPLGQKMAEIVCARSLGQ